MTIRFSPLVFIGCAVVSFVTSYSAFASARSNGQELYERHCSECHSMTTSPKSAPPIAGLFHFYHKVFDDRVQSIRHITDFFAKPEVAKSKLKPRAITRFELMPAVELDARDLRTVSEWLWDQHDPKFLPPECPAQ